MEHTLYFPLVITLTAQEGHVSERNMLYITQKGYVSGRHMLYTAQQWQVSERHMLYTWIFLCGQ